MSTGRKWAAIMAGGAGTRFWPLSRRGMPKPFLDILGDKPLIRLTADRVRPLTGDPGILAVVGEHLRRPTRQALPGMVEGNIVTEPIARNTLGAVLLATARVLAVDPDGVLAILPADHLIPDVAEFRKCLATAYRLAQDYVVCLGVVPTHPETGYGYIRRGGALNPAADGKFGDAAEVERFVEKPDAHTAAGFLADGGYYWNAGIFIFQVRSFVEELGKVDTAFAQMVRDAAKLFAGGEATPARLQTLMEPLPNISIDHAVMEKGPPMAVVPARFRWSDVGSWDAAFEHRPCGTENFVKGETLIDRGAGNVVVNQSGRQLVAVTGLSDMVVVVTDDAVLVARRGEGQQVGKMVARLDEIGREDLK